MVLLSVLVAAHKADNLESTDSTSTSTITRLSQESANTGLNHPSSSKADHKVTESVVGVSLEIDMDASYNTYTTKLANALSQLLGHSEELKMFDIIHSKSKSKRNEHYNLLAQFQTKTLQEKGYLLISIEKSAYEA